MEIKKRLITKNFTKGRKSPITRITVHTAVSNSTDLYNWWMYGKFTSGGKRYPVQASSHYYVNQFGQIYQYVRESNQAWTNSSRSSNGHSVTIETWDGGRPNDGKRTKKMYDSLAWLVADIAFRQEIPIRIVGKSRAYKFDYKGLDKHWYFNPRKTCPAGLDLDKRVVKESNKILERMKDNDKDLEGSTKIYMTVKSGEGISQLAKRYGHKDYASEKRWGRIARLNGWDSWRKMNNSLTAGQKIVIDVKEEDTKEDNIEKLQNEIKELEEKLSKANEEIKKINIEKNKFEDEKNETLEQVSKLKKDIGECMNTTEGLRKQIGTKDKRIKTLNGYCKKIKKKNDKLEENLKKCKNEDKESESESSSPIETLKNILNWLRQVGE